MNDSPDIMLRGTRPRPALDALVVRIASKDKTALADLYGECAGIVHGVASTLLRDPDEAEAVTVDVFAQVWRSAWQYDPDRSGVRAWLLTLARSRAIDRLRSRGQRWGRERAFEVAEDFISRDPGPAEFVEAEETRARVRSAIMELPESARLPLVASFYSGLTHQEIADHMSIPLGTVKTRIRSAVETLRRNLGQGGGVR